MTVRLFHVSDLHFGTEDRAALAWFAGLVVAEQPDAVIMTGDLTASARRREFAAACRWLVALEVPVTVEIGNHDMPVWNLWERFTDPTRRFDRLEQVVERTLVLPGVSIVPLRTATRAQWRRNWAEGVVRSQRLAEAVEKLQAIPSGLKIVTCHHPLDGEGKRHTTRGGPEALVKLAAAGANVVLSGHTHDPYDTVSATGVRLIGAGTLSERLRKSRPSFNLLTIDDGNLEVVSRTME